MLLHADCFSVVNYKSSRILVEDFMVDNRFPPFLSDVSFFSCGLMSVFPFFSWETAKNKKKKSQSYFGDHFKCENEIL